MRFSTAFPLATVLLAPLVVSAAPLKRNAVNPNVLVLQFADTLEKLETNFYQVALSKFKAADFTKANFVSGEGVVQQLTTIQSDESTHDTVLATLLKGLNAAPIGGCTFDVSTLVTDPSTTIASARLVELVGVGAYLGAVHLITDPHILTDAGTIATIESRHQSILNLLNGATAIPQAFDMPLGPNEVLAIAGPLIKGCDLGITANQPLTVTNIGTLTAGTQLTFKSPAFNSVNGLFCQIITGGASEATVLPADKCAVPAGINGPFAIFITDNSSPLSGDVINRQSQKVVAGPALDFADVVDDLTSDLIRKKA